MKKILFVINQLYKGGAETSLVNLLNHLDDSKYAAELLILNQCPVEHAISLVGQINKNIKVCDAYQEYQNLSIFDRIRGKYLYTMEQKGAYYLPALDFVRNKQYDWAFFIGEWSSPSFVAYEVQSKIKAAWIHNDLSEAEYFDSGHYFYFSDMFDYFIFVSQNSLKASVEAYPFLKGRAVCIYNINDVEDIRKKSLEECDELIKQPYLLTCANFRQQKNHLRQVRVMAELKRRGVNFTWINVGAITDVNLVNKVRNLCVKEGLSDRFLILGSKENPYCYMKQAEAVTVLSDYESWSMVITEAKILGVPVISTKTSGALEQIEDGKTGKLTEFDVSDIADKIEEFFRDKTLGKRIRKNISNFDNTQDILVSFDSLIAEGVRNKERKKDEKRILYVIDDINYLGGAHIATKLQIQEFLKQGRDISIFSGSIPNLNIREELPEVHFLSWKDFREDVLFHKRLADCMTNQTLTREEKRQKRKMFKQIRIHKDPDYYENYVLPQLAKLFSAYDIICVTSEGSAFRRAAADSSCKKKIQWIHIDYCDWKDKSEWNQKITQNDNEIYQNFDLIVMLTESIKESFCNLYPNLKEKVVVNKNLIPTEKIKKMAQLPKYKNIAPVTFVTVGRMDYQKAYPRLIKILRDLRQDGYNFRWTIVGAGEEFLATEELINQYGLGDWITMKGAMDNPFSIMAKRQIFALLSDFEGIPNTIYEALVLGIPVLATDVGGISSQLTDGENGWLVENNEREIKKKLEYLMLHQEEIKKIKENIKDYFYDNQLVKKINEQIFN